jgi:hypothetical protein
VSQHRRRQYGKDQRKPCRRYTGQPVREPRDAGEEDEQQAGGPDNGRDALRDRRRHDCFARPDEQRKRQIDQPRPVHRHALRRVQPVLRQIEPALSGEQVAHLDEPHGVVGRRLVATHEADEKLRHDRGELDDDQKRSCLESRLGDRDVGTGR